MYHHMITLGKFLVLFALFVAFVPGVLLKITGGSKDPFFPVIIHGFAFALVYSILSYIYWFHKEAERVQKQRYMNQLLMSQVESERLDRLEAAIEQ
jgi:hypothetical protein